MCTDDVDDLLTIFADPRVMASFGVGVFDRAQMERWVQRNLEHQQRYGYGKEQAERELDEFSRSLKF